MNTTLKTIVNFTNTLIKEGQALKQQGKNMPEIKEILNTSFELKMAEHEAKIKQLKANLATLKEAERNNRNALFATINSVVQNEYKTNLIIDKAETLYDIKKILG